MTPKETQKCSKTFKSYFPAMTTVHSGSKGASVRVKLSEDVSKPEQRTEKYLCCIFLSFQHLPAVEHSGLGKPDSLS